MFTLTMIPLNYTGRVTVTGTDSLSFLQNILSNDLGLLETTPHIQACLLTPQGKYLHDVYIQKTEHGYILHCEGGERAEDLARRLSLYKLRADIHITCLPQTAPPPLALNFDDWDIGRIRHAHPNGSRDAEIGVSTLAELNLDQVAVSYTKGCYIGQELVARMHNRNLGKKHLVAVEFFDTPPPSGTDLGMWGMMRSSCARSGLILMPRDTEDLLRKGTNNHDAPFRLLGL